MKRAFLIGVGADLGVPLLGADLGVPSIPAHVALPLLWCKEGRSKCARFSGSEGPGEPKNLAHLVSPFIGCREEKEEGAGKN